MKKMFLMLALVFSSLALIGQSIAISTAAEFEAITSGNDYHLTNDIPYLSSTYTPIANFDGELDGNGYEVGRTEIYGDAVDGLGIFKKTNGAFIHDLEVVGMTVHDTAGSNYASTGALVGHATNTRFERVDFDANDVRVTWTGSGVQKATGTLCGRFTTTSSAVNQVKFVDVNSGTVSTKHEWVLGDTWNGTGGIVGSSDGVGGWVFHGLTLNGSTHVQISSASINVGGLVGCLDNTAIRHSNPRRFNFGTHNSTNMYNVGSVAGKSVNSHFDYITILTNWAYFDEGHTNVGGIVGLMEGGILQRSYNKNDIDAGIKNVGGLVGQCYNCTIRSSAMYNKIECSTTASNVGGVVGYLTGPSAYTKDVLFCSNTLNGTTNLGGVAGKVDLGATVEDYSYYDYDILSIPSGITSYPTVTGNGTAVGTTLLQQSPKGFGVTPPGDWLNSGIFEEWNTVWNDLGWWVYPRTW